MSRGGGRTAGAVTISRTPHNDLGDSLLKAQWVQSNTNSAAQVSLYVLRPISEPAYWMAQRLLGRPERLVQTRSSSSCGKFDQFPILSTGFVWSWAARGPGCRPPTDGHR